MGVSAFVHCRCWRDGVAVAPPGIGPIGFDESGRLGLLVPWSRDNADEHGAVEDWLRNGCSHPDMEFLDEQIGAWAAVHYLAEALVGAGAANFPVLLRHLPKTNDGCIPAAAVPAVLAELDFFESSARLADEIVLVDEATGDALYGYLKRHHGVFSWGRYDFGVDPAGFFVVDRAEPPVTLFRAMRFEQRVLPGGELELTGDGRQVRLATTPVAGFLPVPPQRLAVRVRPRSAADFRLVAVLRRLGAAALTTGNPIGWT
ncbi:hypothetical protein [Actinoplanes sp. NPDC026619]|uniref:hypothetical protein n=1 Tax=Actinoplanes sp. NPDC026619 TaxID=3155798 RepID=UPI0033DA2AE4